jgi:hypothetical protein
MHELNDTRVEGALGDANFPSNARLQKKSDYENNHEELKERNQQKLIVSKSLYDHISLFTRLICINQFN